MTTELFNVGIGGNNTRQILARLEADCLAHKPSLVVLLAGANDALNSHNLVPPEEFSANMAEIITRVKEIGAQLLLCTMLPYVEPFLLARHSGPEEYGAIPHSCRYAQTQAAIRSLAEQHGLPLVDLYALFTGFGEPHTGANSLLRNGANCGVDDGVHPTADGYRIIGVAVWQAIQSNRLPTQRIVCLGDSITFGAHMEGAGTVGGATYPAILARLLCAHAQ